MVVPSTSWPPCDHGYPDSPISQGRRGRIPERPRFYTLYYGIIRGGFGGRRGVGVVWLKGRGLGSSTCPALLPMLLTSHSLQGGLGFYALSSGLLG